MKIKVMVYDENDNLTNQVVFDSEAEADQWVIDVGPYLPANPRIEKTDVTQAYADSAAIDAGIAAQGVGDRARALVYAINAEKNLTSAQLIAMLDDATLRRAERLLLNGALETAKVLIGQIDEQFFTAAEKARVIDLIDRGGNLI